MVRPVPAPDPHRIITQLDLSVRTCWRLYKAALFTVAKIVERAPEELLELFGERGGVGADHAGAGAIESIRRALARAKAEADSRFRVVPSRNLTALLDGAALRQSALQPRTCHMQQFRHVVTPLGVFACPAHRGNPRSRFAGPKGYADPGAFGETMQAARAQIARFDAASECRQITCIYNAANWWLEDLVASGGAIEEQRAPDLFL